MPHTYDLHVCQRFDGDNAAGNRLKDDLGCNYAWDAEGRLKSVSGCATLNFTYNALGQRVRKQGLGVGD